MIKKSYEENGISLSKKTIYSGDKIKLIYNGILAQSGASSVYLHIGFGEMWDNSSFIPMQFEKGVFSTEIDINEAGSFEVCFKDCADNWDNNSGQNYVFKITKKPVRKNKNEKPAVSAVQKSTAKNQLPVKELSRY